MFLLFSSELVSLAILFQWFFIILITLNKFLGSTIPANLFLTFRLILRVNKKFARITCVIFRCIKLDDASARCFIARSLRHLTARCSKTAQPASVNKPNDVLESQFTRNFNGHFNLDVLKKEKKKEASREKARPTFRESAAIVLARGGRFCGSRKRRKSLVPAHVALSPKRGPTAGILDVAFYPSTTLLFSADCVTSRTDNNDRGKKERDMRKRKVAKWHECVYPIQTDQ